MIVLVGDAASGKDTLRAQLIKLGYEPALSTTTRLIRPTEQQDREYHFVSEEKFHNLIKNDALVQYVTYKNVDEQNNEIIQYYGMNKDDLGDNKVLILNPEGVRQFLKKNIPCAVFYIRASEEVRKKRLQDRGWRKEQIDIRLSQDDEDFEDIYSLCDYMILNNGNKTPEQIAKEISKLYQENSASLCAVYPQR